jgi:hypothetical protein
VISNRSLSQDATQHSPQLNQPVQDEYSRPLRFRPMEAGFLIYSTGKGGLGDGNSGIEVRQQFNVASPAPASK